MIRRIAETIRRNRLTTRFGSDSRGVSAVEFALISPLMIGLYLGGVEITQGIGVDRKVGLTAGAIANLSAQTATLSSTDMTNIMNAATAIMAPYSTTPLKITVSCLNIDANKAIKVKWSATQGGTARTVNSSVSIPTGLVIANSQLLFSEVSYGYKPTIGYVITGTLNLAETMYMSPRISAPSYPDSTHTCT